MLGVLNGASSPWQVSGFLPSAHYSHHSPYPSSPASYYALPPASPSFMYHAGMMPQWGFPGTVPPQTPATKPMLQVEQPMLQWGFPGAGPSQTPVAKPMLQVGQPQPSIVSLAPLKPHKSPVCGI